MYKDKKVKLTICVIATIIFLGFIALGVLLLIQAHYYKVLEFEKQMEQFGFYKKDIILLLENNYKNCWCCICGVISLIVAVCGIFVTWFNYREA